MSKRFVVSSAGIALIKRFEGYHAAPVGLADGRFVVGHGHVRLSGGEDLITPQEAEALLHLDLAPIEACLDARVTVNLSQAEVDALASFAFSIGVTQFERSDVLRRVNGGEPAAAVAAMAAWRKGVVGGEAVVLDALIRRRAAEAALFLSEDAAAPAPSALIQPEIDHAAAILGAPTRLARLPALAELEAGAAPELSELDAAHLPAPRDVMAERLTQIIAAEPATRRALTAPAPRAVVALEPLELTALVAEEPQSAAVPAAARGGWSADAVAFVSLVVFGLALCAIGVAALIGPGGGRGDLLGFAAFTGPGLVAAAAGAYYLLKGEGAGLRPWPLAA